MAPIGEQVADVVRCAHSELLLVAPYIKAPALRHLLGNLTTGVRLSVITRWKVEDVAAGVTDLDVLDVVEREFSGELRICPMLHAKYYRADNKAVAGSANVTFKALGMCSSPNIELLVDVDPNSVVFRQFETELLAQSFRATEDIRSAIASEVDELRAKIPASAISLLADDASDINAWLPACMRPELLYNVYSGVSASVLDSTLRAATRDIRALKAPPGMSRDAFTSYVREMFRRSAVVQRIEKILDAGELADPAAIGLINELKPEMMEGYDANACWTVLKAWLTYFFPTTYRTRASSEVLERTRVLYGKDQ